MVLRGDVASAQVAPPLVVLDTVEPPAAHEPTLIRQARMPSIATSMVRSGAAGAVVGRVAVGVGVGVGVAVGEVVSEGVGVGVTEAAAEPSETEAVLAAVVSLDFKAHETRTTLRATSPARPAVAIRGEMFTRPTSASQHCARVS